MGRSGGRAEECEWRVVYPAQAISRAAARRSRSAVNLWGEEEARWWMARKSGGVIETRLYVVEPWTALDV